MLADVLSITNKETGSHITANLINLGSLNPGSDTTNTKYGLEMNVPSGQCKIIIIFYKVQVR